MIRNVSNGEHNDFVCKNGNFKHITLRNEPEERGKPQRDIARIM